MLALGIELVEGFSRLGAKVVLIPMQPSQDLPLLREIAQAVPSRVGLLQEDLSPRETLAFVSAMDAVVGMRLHSLIFSCISGVPCVGLVYDPKVRNFLDEVGQPSLPIEDATACVVVDECRSIMSETDPESLLFNVERLKKRARAGLQVIYRYI